MSVPQNLAALSINPAANGVSGLTTPVNEVDDHLNAAYAFIAQLRDEIAAMKSVTVQSWTPNIAYDAKTATAPAYELATGTYSRFADLVVATFTIRLASRGLGSGRVLITGLPIPYSTSVQHIGAGGYITQADGMAGVGQCFVSATGGGFAMVLMGSNSGGTLSVKYENLTSRTRLHGTLIYQVANA